jgi:SAM-dependent methyltransferase
MAASVWKESLRLFFAGRAQQIAGRPSLEELCYVSGRDPRLWLDEATYGDLIASIVDQLGATEDSEVLELGCAAGFLAKGLAPGVRRYIGIDLAAPMLDVARRLKLENAEFRVADGTHLPFTQGTFDASFCYDVVTNFPDFSDLVPLLDELLRVVKPGGAVLVGSVPDEATRAAYERRVSEVAAEFAQIGPPLPPPPDRRPGFLKRVAGKLRLAPWVVPGINCYYFSRESFRAYARERGATLEFADVHRLNPYRGMRFNAILRKSAR